MSSTLLLTIDEHLILLMFDILFPPMLSHTHTLIQRKVRVRCCMFVLRKDLWVVQHSCRSHSCISRSNHYTHYHTMSLDLILLFHKLFPSIQLNKNMCHYHKYLVHCNHLKWSKQKEHHTCLPPNPSCMCMCPHPGVFPLLNRYHVHCMLVLPPSVLDKKYKKNRNDF